MSIASEQEMRLKPGKYIGYPVFSKWMASSDDFLVLRRFGQLNSRVLLFLQDELTRKEDEMNSLDDTARNSSGSQAGSGSFRYEQVTRRNELLRELVPVLKEYNDYMVSYSAVKSWPSAQPFQILNVSNWFSNNAGAIADEEQAFIQKEEDVIAIVNKPKSPLRLTIDKFPCVVISKLFRAKPKNGHIECDTTNYYNNSALEIFVTAIIITLGLVLLFAPMWALAFVEDNAKRLGIITGCVCLFTALLASSTVAKPFEVLAATAAYSAVLMVFLQLGSDTRPHVGKC